MIDITAAFGNNRHMNSSCFNSRESTLNVLILICFSPVFVFFFFSIQFEMLNVRHACAHNKKKKKEFFFNAFNDAYTIDRNFLYFCAI